MNSKRYAVIGDPISHSLSPLMHAGWIADHGLDATYEALRVHSDDPITAIRALTDFAGLNVTVPLKEAAAKAADISEDVVANVLRRELDGSLLAFNTDGAGFLDALGEAAPMWRQNVQSAVIVGAGGAARAIAGALAGQVRLVIVNRTHARGAALANAFPGSTAGVWAGLPALFSAADLIVNATTLGMAGTQSPAWPVAQCRPGTIVADIVYRPLVTPLLQAARERGLVAMDGLGMLIHQGARAFELWFGVKPDTSKARQRLMAALS